MKKRLVSVIIFVLVFSFIPISGFDVFAGEPFDTESGYTIFDMDNTGDVTTGDIRVRVKPRTYAHDCYIVDDEVIEPYIYGDIYKNGEWKSCSLQKYLDFDYRWYKGDENIDLHSYGSTYEINNFSLDDYGYYKCNVFAKKKTTQTWENLGIQKIIVNKPSGEFIDIDNNGEYNTGDLYACFWSDDIRTLVGYDYSIDPIDCIDIRILADEKVEGSRWHYLDEEEFDDFLTYQWCSANIEGQDLSTLSNITELQNKTNRIYESQATNGIFDEARVCKVYYNNGNSVYLGQAVFSIEEGVDVHAYINTGDKACCFSGDRITFNSEVICNISGVELRYEWYKSNIIETDQTEYIDIGPAISTGDSVAINISNNMNCAGLHLAVKAYINNEEVGHSNDFFGFEIFDKTDFKNINENTTCNIINSGNGIKDSFLTFVPTKSGPYEIQLTDSEGIKKTWGTIFDDEGNMYLDGKGPGWATLNLIKDKRYYYVMYGFGEIEDDYYNIKFQAPNTGGNSSGGNQGGGSVGPSGGDTQEEQPEKTEKEEAKEPEPIAPVAPPKTSIGKIKVGKKSFTLSWKIGNAVGYQIQYSTNSKFRKGKNTKLNTFINKKTTTKKITGLKSKKKYYVRMRAYNKDKKGGKVFSSWSKKKTVKTK